MNLLIHNHAISSSDKLPIPRFASIKSNEVVVRSGPGSAYKVLWIFVKKNEPIEMIEEFENWRKIRDVDGQIGWVHSRMLIGKRHVVVIDISKSNTSIKATSTTSKNRPNAQTYITMYKSSSARSREIAHLHYNLRCQLLVIDGDWCKINCNNIKGWVEKPLLWGVYNDEIS